MYFSFSLAFSMALLTFVASLSLYAWSLDAGRSNRFVTVTAAIAMLLSIAAILGAACHGFTYWRQLSLRQPVYSTMKGTYKQPQSAYMQESMGAKPNQQLMPPKEDIKAPKPEDNQTQKMPDLVQII